MKKYLPLLLLLLAPAARGQCTDAGVMDFRAGTNGNPLTQATLNASTVGLPVADNWTWQTNLTGAMTYSTAAHGAFNLTTPFCTGGSYSNTSTLGTDYASSGGGLNFIQFFYPTNAGTFPFAMAGVWMSTNFAQNSSVNIDMGPTETGPSRFVNLILFSDGVTLQIKCETSPGPQCNMTPSPTPIASSLTSRYWIATDYENTQWRGVVYAEDPVHPGSVGSLVGSWTVGTGSSGVNPIYTYFGDALSGLPAGNHTYFDHFMVCYKTNCSWPFLPTAPGGASFLSSGIISPARATDWTQAGIPGFNNGTLPDTAWTQCGATVAAGATFATVQAAITACGANQFVLLGPGTFSFNTALLQMKSNMALRGSGANSTFLNASATNGSCAQGTTLLCFTSNSNAVTNAGTNTNICNWTAGYAQGSNQITLSSLSGNCPASISTTTPTLLFLDQCDTGLTGSLVSSACTGSSTDNGNLFICGQKWLGGPAGCSSSGPDGGGSRDQRTQMEAHVVTSVAGSVYTISPPLIMPNWAAGQFPQVYIAQPIVNAGIENLAIDVSNPSGPNVGIGCVNGYHVWVSGVKISNGNGSDTNFLQCVNSIIQDSYIFQDRHGAGTNNAGYDFIASFNMVVQNNICQNVVTCFFDDGASSGTVLADNFAIGDNGAITGNDLIPSYTGHAYNYFNLQEGNAFSQLSCDDNHGTCDFDTKYRNFLTGWSSFPTNPKGADTSSIEDYPFSRYHNNSANVMGTPGYHNTYKSTSVNPTIIKEGAPFGSVPLDPLTASTSLHWAEYNIVQNTVRFCGNSSDTGWGTTCASTSEAPTAAAVYPNIVPTKGDTAIGQGALPPSFFHTSRPAYWPIAIPWPAIGPDVSGGNVGQCAGALNTVGKFNGVPATSQFQCAASALNPAWAGHVNANPAMSCYLTVMNGPPDGSGGLLSFDANTCYSGSGPGLPAVSLSPTSLPFGNIALGSNAQLTTTLTNTGTGTLNISSIAIIGTNSPDFSQSNTCGSVVPAGSNCTITVTFTPIVVGLETASVVITDDASGSPQTIPMTGTGTKAVAQINPAGLNFGTFTVGVTSPSLQITVTNTGNSNLLITSITIGGTNPGDFAQVNTCVNVGLAPTNSCFVNVTFTPVATGARTAVISFVGNQLGGTAQVPLTGAGTIGTALQGITIQGATIK